MVSVHINRFFKKPTGAIIKTYIFSDGRVGYYDNDKCCGDVSIEEYKTWELLDIADFPNARDPKLPYVFDLRWDLKYMSDLSREINYHPEKVEILNMMKKYNIKL